MSALLTPFQLFCGPKAHCTSHPALLCTTALAKKYFPVLICSTKLAQSTSQYNQACTSTCTTLYHKSCTSTSQYNFVLQACTKYFPVVLVPQRLRKVLPRTNFVLHQLAQHFPVLLCTTKVAQGPSQYYCILQECTTYFTYNKLLHREAFRQRSFYKQKASTHRKASAQESLYADQLLQTEAFTRRSLYTQEAFYIEKLSCKRSLYVKKSCKQQAFTHSKLSHRNFVGQRWTEIAAPKRDLGTKAI